jgi:hypothetical protein
MILRKVKNIKKAAIKIITAFQKNDIDMCVGYIFSTINSLRLFF